MPDTMPADPAKHVNYVRGMVLEVDEFKQEFAYHSGRDRWLAREVIGYGTLRGLALGWEKDPTGKLQARVLVKSGVALSPCGQLICVSSDQCADINQWLAARTDEISGKFAAGASSGEIILHVSLAYSDCPTDDAPVPGEPCRSEQDLMQPSRITDSFQLELSYDAPLQAEEDALRGFSAWLRKLSIVPESDASVTLGVFMQKVRAWDAADSDPASITISVVDVPVYSTTALRLWVTELRPAVERSGALYHFKTWLANVPHKTTGTTTEQEFLAEIRRWTPRTYAWPGNLVIKDSNQSDFTSKALTLWDQEIAPRWYAEPCGCRAPANPEYCDDRLLLGTLRFKVVKNAGNSWEVVIPATLSADTPVVDELQRPVLGHLRALEAQLIPSPEPEAEGTTSFVPPHVAPYRHVAMGRLTPGQTQITPVFGNLRVSDVKSGEVYFTFDGYSKPDSEHDYIVQVIASYHISTTSSSRAQPAVSFAGFNETDFFYKVARASTAVSVAELKTIEFQVEVSIIVKPT